LGSVYARERYGVGQPRVGILTIGEEAGKGNALVKAAGELLETTDWASTCGARYIGNVEGRDLLIGTADVIVTDGFTGNVVLKSLEGGYAVFEAAVRAALRSNLEVAATAPVVDAVLEPLFAGFDPVRTGGALLLGTRGVSLIAHGSSSAIAIANAIATADDLVRMDIVGSLRKSIITGSEADDDTGS
jgi:glycerol-3-phosphate acyltransferase PlsX